MKQLIHSSGPTIVAAFNNVAYAFIFNLGKEEIGKNEKVIVELNASSKVENSVKVEEKGKENQETTSTDNGETDPSNSNNEEGDLGDVKDAKDCVNFTIDDQKKANSIQAVASHWIPEHKELLYAISRCDKTIDIYCISLDEIQSGDDVKPIVMKLDPVLSHKTPKRCCSLAFAAIPSKDESEKLAMVIVAGDLNGDATAYKAQKQEDHDSSQCSRVLLGHTASVLTSIEIVDDDGGRKIFTSDRDEKVRISSFPETFHVQGYLLGHSSYISDVKVLRNKMKKCVTCSGDGTLRLFDYERCKEDVTVEVPHKLESENTDANEDSASAPNMPVRVAINPTGTALVVIYDTLTTVQLFAIEKQSDCVYDLKHVQNIECKSVPLGIVFDSNNVLNILTQKEKIIRLGCNGNDQTYQDMEDEVSKMMSRIVVPNEMPNSLMETDEYGNLKLKKKALEESQGFVKNEPWLNKERKEKYKASQRRRKRRKFQQEKEHEEA